VLSEMVWLSSQEWQSWTDNGHSAALIDEVRFPGRKLQMKSPGDQAFPKSSCVVKTGLINSTVRVLSCKSGRSKQ
jgi:hypothetical protein